jgi:hypothetical protein
MKKGGKNVYYDSRINHVGRGGYALISGKMKLTKNMQLEGRLARFAGITRILPILLSIITGVIFLMLTGLGYIKDNQQIIITIIDLFFMLAGFSGPYLLAKFSMNRKLSEVPLEIE